MESRRVIQGRRTPDVVVQYHIQRQRSSGLGISEYCRRQGFSAWTFHLWRQRMERQEAGKLPERGPGLSFVEVAAAALPRGYELELGDGLRLRFGRDSSPAEVGPLVRALRNTGGGR